METENKTRFYMLRGNTRKILGLTSLKYGVNSQEMKASTGSL